MASQQRWQMWLLVGVFGLCGWGFSPSAQAKKTNQIKRVVNHYVQAYATGKPHKRALRRLLRVCQARKLTTRLAMLQAPLQLYRKRHKAVVTLLQNYRDEAVTPQRIQRHLRLLAELHYLNELAIKAAKRLVRTCR